MRDHVPECDLSMSLVRGDRASLALLLKHPCGSQHSCDPRHYTTFIHRAVCIIRGPDGNLVVGSARPRVDPALGPAWARSGGGDVVAMPADGSARQQQGGGFKLLYAGTADKVLMLELEADQARGIRSPPAALVSMMICPCTSMHAWNIYSHLSLE